MSAPDPLGVDAPSCEHSQGCCRAFLGGTCDEPSPTLFDVHPETIYAANFGASGIDYRCGRHLLDVVLHPDNIAEGVSIADYMPAIAGDPAASCEACA